jgi:hypothetical protein
LVVSCKFSVSHCFTTAGYSRCILDAAVVSCIADTSGSSSGAVAVAVVAVAVVVVVVVVVVVLVAMVAVVEKRVVRTTQQKKL